MGNKSCCFIGHRQIAEVVNVRQKVFAVVENLVKSGVLTFLFGSRSEFDSVCYGVVTELKENYPDIIRIAYDTKSESSVLENNRIELEKVYSKFLNHDICLRGYEQIVKSKVVWKSGKASYIERNQLMIDDSDYCVFYYNVDYVPKQRLISKKSVNGTWTSKKSGTALAYEYAKHKDKIIINIF